MELRVHALLAAVRVVGYYVVEETATSNSGPAMAAICLDDSTPPPLCSSAAARDARLELRVPHEQPSPQT